MIDSTKSVVTLDDLVGYIALVVADRYSATRQPTDGAVLAEKIRQKFPQFSYEQVGLLKLADAVEYAERKGLVVRNRYVKHLEIRPRDARDAEDVSQIETNVPGRTPHIRPDVWRAFVYIAPNQVNYFDRQTGEVINHERLEAAVDPSQHVRIPAIPLVDQQKWMEDFLALHPGIDSTDAPIRDPYCFTKLPVWLREHETGLEREWKQYRVQRVVDRIRTWAKENAIDVSAFFSSPVGQVPPDKGRSSPSHAVPHERAIRAAIVAAARTLPIEQLQDISIPIRFLLQALKGSY